MSQYCLSCSRLAKDWLVGTCARPRRIARSRDRIRSGMSGILSSRYCLYVRLGRKDRDYQAVVQTFLIVVEAVEDCDRSLHYQRVDGAKELEESTQVVNRAILDQLKCCRHESHHAAHINDLEPG